MNSKELVLSIFRDKGAADALDLRNRASTLDGTALIAEEEKIPRFDPTRDYSAWPAGAPVWDEVDGERQVYTLITPYNASYYSMTSPSALPALWSVRHTKDPAKAKAWLAPSGTSGLYEVDECCTQNSHVWKNRQAGNAFSPEAVPSYWEDLGAIEEVKGS